LGLITVLPLGHAAAEAYWRGRNVQTTLPGAGHFITLALVPAAAGPAHSPKLLLSGGTLVIEMLLPSGLPGLALACHIRATAREIAELRRSFNRDFNDRRSGRVVAGMILLLAICGWITGGDHGATQAVAGGAPLPDDVSILPDVMLQQLGARRLHPAEMPALFDMLRDICRRAGLSHLPDLYLLDSAGTMNAYALGGPRRSAITLTDGLLQGMTRNEVAGILAHEVAHIRNGDARAMTWASTLHRAIALTALTSLAALPHHDGAAPGPLAALLRSASAIGELLYLALSRIRELDADATALELIDDPQALVSALHKLECHHNARNLPALWPRDGWLEFLRSHPATWERVGNLHRLAAAAI
jgi:heat shock protein HtpX